VLVTQEGLLLLEEIDKLSIEMNSVCDTLNVKEKNTLNELLDKLRK
jgi:hypothetical protein